MSFEKWVQTRLSEHGFTVASDGDWGRNSINQLKKFQIKFGLDVTGTTTSETIEALRREPIGKIIDGAPVIMPAPDEKMPPWMAELYRRMDLHEVRDNKTLISFLKIGKYLGNPKNLPWCGDAIESAIAKTLPDEVLPSNPFFAQNWNKFGINVRKPIVGSIGPIRWNASSGHVGVVVGYDKDRKRVYLLGGNQSNEINITSFPESKFMGYRWPSTYPVKNYPALRADNVSTGGLGSTR